MFDLIRALLRIGRGLRPETLAPLPYRADHKLYKVVCTDRYATGTLSDYVVKENLTKGAAKQLADFYQNRIDNLHPNNEELYVTRTMSEQDFTA